MSEIKLIILKSVDDEFLIKLQHLFNEYGYQLPMESKGDTSLSFDGLELLLIVEDDKQTNEAICEYLKSAGHKLISAYDGARFPYLPTRKNNLFVGSGFIGASFLDFWIPGSHIFKFLVRYVFVWSCLKKVFQIFLRVQAIYPGSFKKGIYACSGLAPK